MNNLRPDIIATEKASKHPLKSGRFYTGKVSHVSETGLVTVYINELQSSFGPIVPLNLTDSSKPSIGDYVKCAFSDEFFRELIIFGFAQKKEDILGSVQSSVNSLTSRVSDLENTSSDQTILSNQVFG